MAAPAKDQLRHGVTTLFAVFALYGCATGIDSSGQRFYLPWSADQPLHPQWNLNFPEESLRLPASPRPDPLPERKRYDDWRDLSPYAHVSSTLRTAAAIGVTDNALCARTGTSSLETSIAAARMDARDSRSVIR